MTIWGPQKPHMQLAVQGSKPLRGKRKAPEPAVQKASDSESEDDDDLSSEDAPLPGEEDPEDSDASDEDVIGQDEEGGPADEAEEEFSESDEEVEEPARKKAFNSQRPASQQQDRKAQQELKAAADEDDNSDEPSDEGDWVSCACSHCLLMLPSLTGRHNLRASPHDLSI